MTLNFRPAILRRRCVYDLPLLRLGFHLLIREAETWQTSGCQAVWLSVVLWLHCGGGHLVAADDKTIAHSLACWLLILVELRW